MSQGWPISWSGGNKLCVQAWQAGQTNPKKTVGDKAQNGHQLDAFKSVPNTSTPQ